MFYDIEHDSTFQLININSNDVYYRYSNSLHQYMWIDHAYMYELSCKDYFPIDVVAKIIDGLKLKNNI